MKEKIDFRIISIINKTKNTNVRANTFVLKINLQKNYILKTKQNFMFIKTIIWAFKWEPIKKPKQV